eukprot:GFYU01007093.1.p1 GENE.GFYU01007093.1~~GFYU01007093.1.p1  ORF type:complete len:179 (-),score=21.01 GFYU01007093.1:204-740(-)
MGCQLSKVDYVWIVKCQGIDDTEEYGSPDLFDTALSSLEHGITWKTTVGEIRDILSDVWEADPYVDDKNDVAHKARIIGGLKDMDDHKTLGQCKFVTVELDHVERIGVHHPSHSNSGGTNVRFHFKPKKCFKMHLMKDGDDTLRVLKRKNEPFPWKAHLVVEESNDRNEDSAHSDTQT